MVTVSHFGSAACEIDLRCLRTDQSANATYGWFWPLEGDSAVDRLLVPVDNEPYAKAKEEGKQV